MSPILFFIVLTCTSIVICSGRGVNIGLCDDWMYGCKCGKSETKAVLRIKQCTYVHRWRTKCKPCDDVEPEDLCSKFLNCAQCHSNGGSECVSCPPQKFGTWCEANCDCRNDAVCDRQGKCLCPEGFEGVRCERRSGCVPPQSGIPPLQENLLPPENPLTITYSCPADYELRGTAMATCLLSGQWSSPPPQCFRKCPLLSAPPGGSLEYSNSQLVEGVTAMVRCHEHHRLIGETDVKCLPGGVWSKVLPFCEQLDICPDPGLTPYSTRQVGPPGSSQTGPFFEGMTLKYTCAHGFQQMGDDTISCLPEGTWSGEPAVCIKVSQVVPGCVTKGSDVLQETGVPIRLFCPPECAQSKPNVFGTSIYTTSSAICPAAVHSGMVTNSGGLVEIISNGDYPFFIGSNLNKIQSKSFDEQSESFRFNRIALPTTNPENEGCSKGLVKVGEFCVYISNNLKNKEEAEATCTNLGLLMAPPGIGKEENETELNAFLKNKGISQVWTGYISILQGNFSSNDEEANKNVSDVGEAPEPRCGIAIVSDNQMTEDLADCEQKMNFICFQDLNGNALASCEEQEPLVNGQEEHIGRIDGIFYVGSSIEFTCNPLHYMKGEAVVSCTANGTWTAVKPRCIRVNTCDEPLAPIGGSVDYLLPKPESPLQRKAFIHSLSTSRLARIPIGLGTGPLEELNNVTTTPEPETEDIELPPGKRKVGTRAIYECESRYYQLVGSRIRRCENGGRWSGRPPSCMPKCGQSDSPKTPFIVNGNATDIGQWPWQAAVFRWIPRYKQWFLICGGSLLNERWVITAAHCVTYPASNVLFSKEKFRIYLGKYHRQITKDDEHVQIRKVHEIHVHPDYDPTLFDADIAVIQLDSPVQLSSRTQPVCLPTEQTSRVNLVAGKQGVVTGWGMNENEVYSETLQQAVLPVVPSDTCEKGYAIAEFPLTVTENMFCAGYAEGKADSCSGDSGGPVVFLDPTTKEKRWVLEGIVSWGSPNGCGNPNQYGGFTTVSKFLDWLQLYI